MDAIYARQSVDRTDSISIESQIELCRYELRGRPAKTYADRGYSGKNTERPAFQALMADMRRGLIGKVVVYKLDRISRSILDFSSMMDTFAQYGVEFVSTTEKFDTSSPIGRAMLNICIVFAQLERETIQKRVADAYFSRSRKSLYMGGRVPFGYRLAPAAVGGVKTAMYEAVPQEAEVVRTMYQLYAQPECSYGDIVRRLHDGGVTKRGRPWERARVADILRSPIYVRADLSVYQFFLEQGASVVNDPSAFIGINGCYCYRTKDSGPGSGLAGCCLVLAPHAGLVPADIWLQCRRKNLNTAQVQPRQQAKNSWLAGKIKCGLCGYALASKRYAGSDHRYLLCTHRMDAKACPGPGTVYAQDLEQLVLDELQAKLALFPVLHPRPAAAPSPEAAALQVELARLEQELDGLTQRAALANDTLLRYINQRVVQLDEKKQTLQRRLSLASAEAARSAPPITRHLSCWSQLSFEDKRRAAAPLIQTIRVFPDRVQIQWLL